MLRPIVTLLLSLAVFCAKGQSYTITGSVMDTLNSNGLPSASVVLIHEADSMMETFTRTNNDGVFTLHPKTPGKYILMITFPGFADYVDVANVKDGTPVDMGAIPMVTKAHLLKEFVFTQQYAAIKVKGDTVEYVADSFKVKDNATVDALLKKLPGLQVNKDGEIIAQGEKVQKVLVDGEEFFSDDPAMVTKSLQAKVVDKVQVFDKKSDQAEFTGIDDGEKTKTINLQLKEDQKKGYFGRVTGAGGAGDERAYYENQAMVNAFKGNRKISAFGIMSNTGKMGLGWDDRDKFGGGSGGNTEVDDEGNVMMYYSGNDDDMTSWNGDYNGKGIPMAYTGGTHYSNKWAEDKHHFSGNYRFAQQEIDIDNSTTTQYILPGDKYNTTSQKSDQLNIGRRHRADFQYDIKTDSLSSVKITTVVGYNEIDNSSAYNSETKNNEGESLNESLRTQTTDGFTKTLNSTLDWKKKFMKKGRSFSLNITENYRQQQNDGFLKTVNKFFDTLGELTSIDTIDQRKQNANENLALSSRAVYTEPLSKVLFAEVNYSFKLDNSKADRITTDKNKGTADYIDVNQFLSSNYEFEVLTNTGGASLKFVNKKINANIGSSVAASNFKQNDLNKDTTYVYNFVNLFPRANFTYKFNKQAQASLNYNGSTRQPTLEQLQPLADNNDPLNISIGNPNLTQEFKHNVSARYNNYKPLTGRYIGGSVNLMLTDNAISRTDSVNDRGVRTYQYVNVDGNYSAWQNLWFGSSIKKYHLYWHVYVNNSINHNISYVNNQRNESDNNRYSVGTELQYETKDEKFSASIGPSVAYNDFRSTINTANASYWSMEHEFNIKYEFPLKFEVASDINWFIREKTEVFTSNNNVFKWNAYVSKKFLKNDQLELRASVFDILNQNIGFNRTANNNYITEDRYNTVRRYGLISLIWNFTKSPLTAPAETVK
ncbi:TonB-dependent receptor [Polluticoccus soli]|uniref:TonB-dependent receptor n=1 Tax=Polluticoccus soli TaxID=3034150 RepID=UPI0023E1C951|nr:TonB-dependent receptor [Flavipsychrobacter sp. JY13-12]